MAELWIASANDHKRKELHEILAAAGLDLRLRLMSELPAFPEIVEDGATFADNAAIKAKAVALRARGWAVGDDSGLCVDALDGRPGLHSARYAGPGKSDQDRIARLLAELQGVPDARRTARFVCSLALADPGGTVLVRAEGACEGKILHSARGSGGFGYDPVFLCPEAGKTFAELSSVEKHRLSHRGRALRALLAQLPQQLRNTAS
jgi:XTP/dITP diphosphohydrolase